MRNRSRSRGRAGLNSVNGVGNSTLCNSFISRAELGGFSFICFLSDCQARTGGTLRPIHLTWGQNGGLGSLFRDRGYPKKGGGKGKILEKATFQGVAP